MTTPFINIPLPFNLTPNSPNAADYLVSRYGDFLRYVMNVSIGVGTDVVDFTDKWATNASGDRHIDVNGNPILERSVRAFSLYQLLATNADGSKTYNLVWSSENVEWREEQVTRPAGA